MAMTPGPPMPPSRAQSGPPGTPRSVGTSILLAIVTLGIYTFFWTFKTHEEIKKASGEGVGGGVGLILYILLSPVTYFLVPSEIATMLKAEGRQSPVSGATGFWVLLPIIGSFVWFPKVQGTLNDYWQSKGAVAA